MKEGRGERECQLRKEGMHLLLALFEIVKSDIYKALTMGWPMS